MKKNKWFILAALIGLVLSVGFVFTGCAILEAMLEGGCKNADFSSGCNSSSMNCSSVNCR